MRAVTKPGDAKLKSGTIVVKFDKGRTYLYSEDGGSIYNQSDLSELPIEIQFSMAIRECEIEVDEAAREISNILAHYKETVAEFRRLADKLLDK